MSGAIKKGSFEHWDLLKSVSRSFYLSMRFLPAAMRVPISVAYLLARAADTLADTAALDTAKRLDALSNFGEWLYGKEGRTGAPDFNAYEKILTHSGERLLLQEIEVIVSVLRSLDQVNQRLVRNVLETIIAGQKRDLEDSPVRCQTANDLLQYTYQVAGCVGEFWTEVGFHNLGGRFADPGNREAMLVTGRKLGQGLQLINILRDLHEDLPAGRIYLPTDELVAQGWDGESALTVELIPPVAEKWHEICRGFLDEGKHYVHNVRNFRTKFATALPLLLARSTLKKLEQAGVERVMCRKIKISRRNVWACMIRAALTPFRHLD